MFSFYLCLLKFARFSYFGVLFFHSNVLLPRLLFFGAIWLQKYARHVFIYLWHLLFDKLFEKVKSFSVNIFVKILLRYLYSAIHPTDLAKSLVMDFPLFKFILFCSLSGSVIRKAPCIYRVRISGFVNRPCRLRLARSSRNEFFIF